jgi:putative transposase
LRADADKEMVLEVVREMLTGSQGELHGWVILNNRYHILMKLKNASLLPDLIRRIHSKSAVLLNKQYLQPGRRVWYQYWDKCVRDERDFYAKLNYIYFNPVKHGYVDHLRLYKFSIHTHYLETCGCEWPSDLSRRFPCPEKEDKDDF